MKVLSRELILFLIAFSLRADNGVVCLNKTEVNATNPVDNTTDVVDADQSREDVLGMSFIWSVFSVLELRYRDAILLTLVLSQTSEVIFFFVTCLLEVTVE